MDRSPGEPAVKGTAPQFSFATERARGAYFVQLREEREGNDRHGWMYVCRFVVSMQVD